VIGRLSGGAAGRDAAALLKEGAMSGLSFGYRVREARGEQPRELTDLARLSDVADWFSVPGWRRSAPAVAAAGAPRERWLLVGGDEALHEALRESGQEIVLDDAAADRVVAIAADGFLDLLPLARSLAVRDKPVELTVIARGLFDVLGAEPVRPELATLLGLVRGLPLEEPHVRCRLIDAGPATADEARRWARELLDPAGSAVVALRGPYRWTESWEPARLPPAASRFRQRGVYLITGGFGGLGLTLAGYLSRRYGARLGLLSRNGADGRTDEIRALEKAGAEVLALRADVADPQAVREAMAALRARFGPLHGVLHAAGVPGGGLLRHRTRKQAAAVLAPKVQGTLALAEAVAEEPLDLFVLFSSIVATTGGGPGQTDYTAANAFLDAFAQQQSALGRSVVSVAWGEWQWNAWEEGLASLPPAAKAALVENRRRIGIHPEEGAEALERVLAHGLAHAVVSPVPLPDLLTLSTAEAWSHLLGAAPTGEAAPDLHPRPALGTPYEPPAGPVESGLARIWGEILGIGGVGARDSFFELGGNSLHSVQVTSRVRRAFGTELDARVFFRLPVLRDLARWIEESGATHQGDSPPLVPVPRGGRLPLSFAQHRLWFLDQMEPGTPAYNIPHPLRITGDLDPAAFFGAFDDLAARHEVLRTTYRLEGDEPVQVIHPPAPLPSLLCDLSALPAGRRAAELERLAAGEMAEGFDLAADPMLRVRLVRLSPREHAALLTLHHIAGDGWSAGVVLRDFAAFYEARRSGRSAALPPLAVQYADFAAWQRRWLRGEPLERRLAAWRRVLGTAPPELRLPTDRPSRGAASFQGDRLSFALPAAEAEPLRLLARAEGATLYMVLTAALCALLVRHTGQEDLVLGTEVANRNRLELEDLVGFFVNILPLRFDAGGDPAFHALLARVREGALAAFAVEDLPFDRIVEDVAPERGLARVPLVRLMFVLQNTPAREAALPELVLVPVELAANRTSKFDLLLSIEEGPDGGLRGHWHFSTDLFERTTVERLTARLRALLTSAAESPHLPLRRLDMTTPSERNQPAMEPTRPKTKSFLDVRPKTISVSQESLVRSRPLAEGEKLPLLVEPAAGPVDLAAWAKANREQIERWLYDHGAILFRGFGIESAEKFEGFASALVPELFAEYGDLPAEDPGNRVYSSTPYPPDKSILFHSESSQMHCWPLKQFFLCLTPAAAGGATPVADCRRIYERLDPALRRRFQELGVLYVRNFIPGIDVDWRTFFHTDDPARVEEHCRKAGMTCQWFDGGESLRTSIRCRAVARHPKTGEPVFFNQIQAHHISCLDADTRGSLRSLFSEDRLPRNVYYGDGSPISDAEMNAVRSVYDELAVRFEWRRGDALVLDNMLTAHARDPYEGPRKILVAMGQMATNADLDPFGWPGAPVTEAVEA
jgi:NAD(P)-dependent dehydrogenase (short-subunit alcohol dehydrogenase family)/alpha-ketoglutarate-dependent taurine dioxygenase